MVFGAAESDERPKISLKGQGHRENKMASICSSENVPKQVQTQLSIQACSFL